MERKLIFNSYGVAATTTKSGKDARVIENSMNIRRKLYQLVVDGKTVFSRGTIGKVYEKLETL